MHVQMCTRVQSCVRCVYARMRRRVYARVHRRVCAHAYRCVYRHGHARGYMISQRGCIDQVDSKALVSHVLGSTDHSARHERRALAPRRRMELRQRARISEGRSRRQIDRLGSSTDDRRRIACADPTLARIARPRLRKVDDIYVRNRRLHQCVRVQRSVVSMH